MIIIKRLFIIIFCIGITLSIYQFYADLCVYKSLNGSWAERYNALCGVMTLDAEYGKMVCGHNYAVLARDMDKMEESYLLACKLYAECPNYRDISKIYHLFDKYKSCKDNGITK